ncbi:MAG TPA: hypothetical protein VFD08_03100 [Clostridia bacterium]|nr:hypothetical protein [Clostridia bacterium]
MFPSYEEMGEVLDSLAEELPQVFFEGLNLGVVLFEDLKVHHQAVNEDLIILGEYHRTKLGRQIRIYYRSFRRVYGHLEYEELVEELRETLRHEFTHHIQDLAGDKSLEIEDGLKLAKWEERRKK